MESNDQQQKRSASNDFFESLRYGPPLFDSERFAETIRRDLGPEGIKYLNDHPRKERKDIQDKRRSLRNSERRRSLDDGTTSERGRELKRKRNVCSDEDEPSRKRVRENSSSSESWDDRWDKLPIDLFEPTEEVILAHGETPQDWERNHQEIRITPAILSFAKGEKSLDGIEEARRDLAKALKR